MKMKINYTIGILLMLLITSCDDFLSEKMPINQLAGKEVFSNDKSAISALDNVYAVFNTSIAANFNNHISLYSDEMIYNSSTSSTKEFYECDVAVDNRANLNCWRYFYSIIYQCNFILENVPPKKSISEEIKQQIKGESLFLRAFAYFLLINLYGDVPLLTQTDVDATSLSARSPIADVYGQIETDLIQAETLLSINYPVDQRVRANKLSASALLARVYLYQRKYAEAEEKSSSIIGNELYQLEALENVFKSDSKETILQFWTQDGFPKYVSFFNPLSGSATYVVSSSLGNAFESGDNRKLFWMRKSDSLFYAFKYKNNVRADGKSAEYLIAFRLAEQYLIRAEANLFLNDLEGALSDINTIRRRANLLPLVGLDKNKILAAIEKERQLELFCEWGDRFFDMKRYGNIDKILKPLKPSWSSIKQVLPIPYNEIINNPNLTQNKGY